MHQLPKHWTCPWLVGGALDGRHYPLPPGSDRHVIPVPLPRPGWARTGTLPPADTKTFERAEYVPRSYTMPTCTMTIWVDAALTDHDANIAVTQLMLRALGAHPSDH